ncbi:MAG: zinc ribbon domain-containing protein [Deltaproteobacteria bacterium]|jgi:putative FmdB family regulatory protein|nr:zinc ribbon domain-containing protein [Deltaproteobacteria bacterium]MBW2533815.1 zinc ribbon domain-containing protein [Deltaproteobacteria bacterium]
MPIYEYRCQSCDTEFEDLVRMGTPDEEIECPSCGQHEAKRQLSLTSSHSGTPGVAARAPARSTCGSGGFS